MLRHIPSPQGVKAGESGIQGHPQLHSELEASLLYVRPYLEKDRQERRKGREKKRKEKATGNGVTKQKSKHLCNPKTQPNSHIISPFNPKKNFKY